MKTYQIFLVDDHRLFIEGMVRILEDDTDFAIVGVFHSGEAVLHALHSTVPDLVILDIQMPTGMDGLATCVQIKKRYPESKVMFISMFELSTLMREAKTAGANGYISKTSDAAVVKSTIRAILGGNDTFLTSQKTETNSTEVLPPQLYILSKREKEIIGLIKEGKTSKNIADILNLSHYTVETHRKNIFKKLQLKSVSELVAFAYENGM